MIKIEVFSEEKAWSKKLKKKELFFKKICNFFPRKYRFPNKKITLSLLLSNNKCIKKLNKNFRNKNKSTDILSFPLEKKTSITKSTYIGDIIISYNFMNKPRSQNIKSFKEKVIKTFIHSNPTSKSIVSWSRADKEQLAGKITFEDGKILISTKE